MFFYNLSKATKNFRFQALAFASPISIVKTHSKFVVVSNASYQVNYVHIFVDPSVRIINSFYWNVDFLLLYLKMVSEFFAHKFNLCAAVQ